MNEQVDQVEREVEGMSFVDLGDAAVETKQQYPSHERPDSTFVWGPYSR